jgi:glyoxylase-like metal-dependent hydrolase (beta-lactamase superfamily II)
MERVDPGNATLKIPAYPKEGLPTVTYSDEMTLHVNGEEIYIFHPANAHSDSDSMVYFPKSNVLTTGDIYYSNNWPLIDLPSKGTVNGVIAAVDRALKIVNANTKVVPGRGPCQMGLPGFVFGEPLDIERAGNTDCRKECSLGIGLPLLQRP